MIIIYLAIVKKIAHHRWSPAGSTQEIGDVPYFCADGETTPSCTGGMLVESLRFKSLHFVPFVSCLRQACLARGQPSLGAISKMCAFSERPLRWTVFRHKKCKAFLCRKSLIFLHCFFQSRWLIKHAVIKSLRVAPFVSCLAASYVRQLLASNHHQWDIQSLRSGVACWHKKG